MSIAAEHHPATGAQATGAPATFGAGGAEPYAHALRGNDPVVLFLHEPRSGELTSHTEMDVRRWNAEADAADLSLLRSATGPLLDIGCGPGRMLRAAEDLGLMALGVDVSPTAVEIAREAGLNVVRRSVFDPIPGEGHWHTVLLVDGNIGIGGDVAAMLRRCAEVMSPLGEIIVELSVDPERDATFTGRIVDMAGGQSESFPWAEIGLQPIRRLAEEEDLAVTQSWSMNGRAFCSISAR